MELRLVEDRRVGQEGDRRPGAGLLCGADLLHRPLRYTPRELLPVDVAVGRVHGGDEPLGEGIDNREADAVQAA